MSMLHTTTQQEDTNEQESPTDECIRMFTNKLDASMFNTVKEFNTVDRKYS